MRSDDDNSYMMRVDDLIPISDTEVSERVSDIPGWQYSNHKIMRKYELNSFADAVWLVEAIVPFCNHLDHHPDVLVSKNSVTFSLTRYSVGGMVTERDFKVASIIEDLFEHYLLVFHQGKE